nr:VENN motif pre-toxin domain-containing protein [Acinetobacter bohemicus]
MGGDYSRGLNAVTTALTAVLGGQTDLQAATNTLAPYAAQVIGQQWGHGKDKNTAAQLAAHAILGATLAYINGGDPTAGGSAAVASEAAATYFTNQYKDNKDYQDANGVFQPNLLPEDIKTQIRDLTAGIGAVIGGAVGDSTYNAQLAGVIGQNAVENNGFSIIDENYGKVVKENTKEKWSCPTGYVCPIPEKTLGEKTLLVINDLTIRQLAAAMGAEYDPVTKEHLTPKEIQEAKVAMLSLGFSKTLNGPIKLTDEAIENIGKKYGKDITKIVMEPEADFAGRVPVRPRDGYINAGTKQIDTPLGKHLIEAAVNKKSKIISGGHNADNFYEILNANGGKLVGQPTQISKGIIEVKYQLPNGRIQPKTIYDPKVYNDAQMASMANQAAAKAIVNYGVNGKAQQNVVVNGITFRVPIDTRSGAPKVPTSFPINPKTP